MKSNYHTHTYLCGHAMGSIEDYVVEAIKLGYKELGMSDHSPNDLLDDHIRMTEDQFYDYINDFYSVKQKYKDKIKLYIGVEAEYLEKYPLNYPLIEDKLDYMILGQHYLYDEENNKLYGSQRKKDGENLVKEYVNQCIKALKTKKFKIFAHPDIVLANQNIITDSMKEDLERLVITCVEENVYIECNCGGIRRGKKEDGSYQFPRKEFFELVKKHNGKVIVGVDAHRPAELSSSSIKEANDFLEDIGIKEEVEVIL